MRVLILTVLAVCLFPASAGAVELVSPDGSVAQPYQSWADRAKAPMPNVRITVQIGRTCNPALACLTGGGSEGLTMWLRDRRCGLGRVWRSCQFVVFHEIRHAADTTDSLFPEQREQFLAVFGVAPGTPWNSNDAYPPSELYADAGAMCAQGYRRSGIWTPRDWLATYWQPSQRQYLRACRLIRQPN